MLNEIIRRYEETNEVIIEDYDAIRPENMDGINGVYTDMLSIKKFMITEIDFIVDAIKRLAPVISESTNSEEVSNLFKWISENPKSSIYEYTEATGIEISEKYRRNPYFDLYNTLRGIYLQITDRETALIQKSVDKALIYSMKAWQLSF